jgi:hypothetical protein
MPVFQCRVWGYVAFVQLDVIECRLETVLLSLYTLLSSLCTSSSE